MPRPALGLFFTNEYIEISKLSDDGRGISKYLKIPLTPQTVLNGEIINKISFINSLKEIYSATNNGINKTHEVIIGINSNLTFLKEIVSSSRPPKELEENLSYQMRTEEPNLPSGTVSDWQIIGKGIDNQIEILIASMSRKTLDSYLECAEAVGLTVVGLEPTCLAATRVIKPIIINQKNQLLVFLGESFAEFTYLTSGNPRYSDYQTLQDIQKRGTIQSVIQDYLSYINTKHPDRLVKEIILSGTHPQISNIFQNLKSQNFDIILAESLLVAESGSGLNISHGLSLKTTDDRLSLNLLPVEFRLNLVHQKLNKQWSAVIQFLILISIFIIGLLGYSYLSSKNEYQKLTDIIKSYQEELNQKDNQQIIKQVNSVNSQIDNLSILIEATGREANALNIISKTTTPGVTLTSLTYSIDHTSKKTSSESASWIVTGNAKNRQLVLDYYKLLSEIPEFSAGKLYFGSFNKDLEVSFRIANFPNFK